MTRILPLVVVWVTVWAGKPGYAAEFYASPQGTNSAPGTFDEPWRTVQYGMGQLNPGDTLFLREGVYHENGLVVSSGGTDADPITVRSSTGEVAVIDGGVTDYLSIPNTGWEVVDPDIHLYKTKRTFVAPTAGAWLIDEEVQVIQYERYDCLTSTNWVVNLQDAVYMGPGVYIDGEGYVYIRLEQNPLDLTGPDGDPIPPVPADPNPNQNRIGLFDSRILFILQDAAHLTFRNLEFANAERIFDCRGTSGNLLFDACTFRYREYGILSRHPAVSGVEVKHCEFDSGMGEWLHWTDIKNGPIDVSEAGGEFQNFALSGPMNGWRIHHNLIRDSMDGLLLAADTADCHVTSNVFVNLRDDAINVFPETSHVTIAGNIMHSCFAGVSILGNSAGTRGPVYIHHNIIDFTEKLRIGRTGNYREVTFPNWGAGNPFGGHGDGDHLGYWKIYNNTFIGATGRVSTFSMKPTVDKNPELLVLNNIFHALDNRTLLADDQEASGSFYDGDLFWQAAPGKPMFANFANSNDYYSVTQLVASGTAWETNAIEADAGFDLTPIAEGVSNAHTMAWFALYLPGSPHAFTPGAPYDGLGLPGADGVDYRGAVASNSVGGPLDRDIDQVADMWERFWFGSTTNSDGSADGDGDGLDDRGEYENGCNPMNSDSDHDGIPDGWEVGFGMDPTDDDGAEDPDGDKSRNFDEYIAGTHPREAASRFTISATLFDQTNDAFVVSWLGVSNRLYDIRSSTDLVSGSWTNLIHPASLQGTDAMLSWTNAPCSATSRCYRLHVRLAEP